MRALVVALLLSSCQCDNLLVAYCPVGAPCEGSTNDFVVLDEETCASGQVICDPEPACVGIQECERPEPPPPAPVVAFEVCNALDDDNNGIVDDIQPRFFYPSEYPGTVGIGECRPGVIACYFGVEVTTDAVTPQVEVCDNKDNDCNGVADDTLGPSPVAVRFALDASASMGYLYPQIGERLCDVALYLEYARPGSVFSLSIFPVDGRPLDNMLVADWGTAEAACLEMNPQRWPNTANIGAVERIDNIIYGTYADWPQGDFQHDYVVVTDEQPNSINPTDWPIIESDLINFCTQEDFSVTVVTYLGHSFWYNNLTASCEGSLYSITTDFVEPVATALVINRGCD